MVIFQFAMGYVKLPEGSSRLVLVDSFDTHKKVGLIFILQ